MPKVFVNRESEIQKLRELAGQPPALVVVQGRRRVGKTALLAFAFEGERTLSFQAEQRPKALQLQAFGRECGGLLQGDPPIDFSDWSQAFEFIEGQASAGKGNTLVVVLDEFQYLAASDRGLLSTVQRFWDRWDASRTPILLVLCGSSLSFMSGMLGRGQPTFGRSVYRPLLLPLDYRKSAAFAPAGSRPAQLIERFAVLGGTPQYQLWGGRVSVEEVIRNNVLPPGAALHSDPEHLIREEDGIREPGPYFGAMQSIAEGYSKTSEIAGRLEIKQQLADQIVSKLQKLGYVTRAEPLEPGRSGRARGYWRISDPYFRFWYRYVLPNRSRILRGRLEAVLAQAMASLPAFVGPIFEQCCRDWVGVYSTLGEDAEQVGSWWSRKHDVEIDVVATAGKRYTLLGSCKWSANKVDNRAIDDLYRGRAALGDTAAKAKLVIFTRNGLTAQARLRAAAESIVSVEASDLLSS